MYSLKNKFDNPFTRKLLRALNSGISITDFYWKLGIRSWEVDIDKGVIVGADLRTELLLIGFNCPDIKRGNAAMWNGYGYFFSSMSGHLECTLSYSIIIPRYEVRKEQVLWVDGVPEIYKVKIHEILSVI